PRGAVRDGHEFGGRTAGATSAGAGGRVALATRVPTPPGPGRPAAPASGRASRPPSGARLPPVGGSAWADRARGRGPARHCLSHASALGIRLASAPAAAPEPRPSGPSFGPCGPAAVAGAAGDIGCSRRDADLACVVSGAGPA